MGNVVARCSHPELHHDDLSPPFLLAATATASGDDIGQHTGTGCKKEGAAVGISPDSGNDNDDPYQTLLERHTLHRPHREERTQLLLLDPTGMTVALLEQAEELLRREQQHQHQQQSMLLDDCTDQLVDSDDDNDDDDDDDDESNDVFSNISDGTDDLSSKVDGCRSVAAQTVATTVSAATQPVRNGTSSRPSTRRPRHSSTANSTTPHHRPQGPHPPRLLDPRAFRAKHLLEEQLHGGLSASARRSLGKAYQRSSTARFHSPTPPPSSSFRNTTLATPNNQHHLPRTGLGASCTGRGSFGGAWWGRDDAALLGPHPSAITTSITLSRDPATAVREHTSVLYLRLHAHCATRSAEGHKHHPSTKTMRHRSTTLFENLTDRAVLAPSMGRKTTRPTIPPNPAKGGAPGSTLEEWLAAEISLGSSSSSSSNSSSDASHRGKCSERDGTFVGVGPPSHPVRLLVTDAIFMDLAVTGSLGWVNRRRRHQSNMSTSNEAAAAAPPTVPTTPERHLVLLNRRSGIPLAVCALETPTGGGGLGSATTVHVYATKRRTLNQEPATSTRALDLDWSSSSSSLSASSEKGGDLPLYHWADVVMEGKYPDRVRYAIHVAAATENGIKHRHLKTEAQPRFVAAHDSLSSPEIAVWGRTDRETVRSGCAVLTLCRPSPAPIATTTTTPPSSSSEPAFWRLCVSQGIDPVLLVCWAAIVDEAVERAIQLQMHRMAATVHRSNHHPNSSGSRHHGIGGGATTAGVVSHPSVRRMA